MPFTFLALLMIHPIQTNSKMQCSTGKTMIAVIAVHVCTRRLYVKPESAELSLVQLAMARMMMAQAMLAIERSARVVQRGSKG
jgi:hypothetical protein